MADDLIASARSMTNVSDGQYIAIGMPRGSLTPATITAMVGINQGTALDLDANVKLAMTKLQTVASSSDYPANVNAQVALTTLTNLQSSLGFGGAPNHAAFGKFINQAQSHIKDSVGLRQATDFLANTSYGDFGSGIKDMGSMADRGLTNVFGSLSAAGKAVSSTGSMFNGISLDNIGKPSGLVEAFQNNKLANATGLNQKLADAGVDLNNLHDPVYQNKISGVLSSIKDPAAINVAAEQFNTANPFAGLPSYTGSDSSLYTNSASKLLGGS